MQSYHFKFKWLDNDGQPQGFYSSKGEFDGETLLLDATQIPSDAFLDVDCRDQRLILSLIGENNAPAHLLFLVTKGSAEKLKLMLGRARSSAWAKRHREELVAEGRGGEYRDVECTHCGAVIDLSGFPATPQVSCEFCHSLAQVDPFEGRPKDENKYRLCDECGMFSKPRKFTIFYFYFLLVIWGFQQRTTWRCPGCMRGDAWKMLLGNLLFVIGVPVAIVQLIRAYGGTDVGGTYPGLDSANIKARAGKFKAAVADYQKILEKQPVAAGVKYNIAHAFLQREDWQGASQMLEYALHDCANYQPAANALAACYDNLDEEGKLAALKEQWSVADEELETVGEENSAEDSSLQPLE